MSNTYFQCKQFTIQQEHCAMKVCTDGCLFGAWLCNRLQIKGYKPRNVLDIGTGTGLLSLILAQKVDALIDAVEIDEAAAEQAFENMDASPWRDRLRVICSDVRIVHLGKKYDLIISNPPFFENDLKSGDPKRNLALHGESLNLEELLLTIKSNLADIGKFALLLPYHRKNEFENLAAAEGFFLEEEASVKQTPTHSFFRAMLLFGTAAATAKVSTITIRQEDEYTPEFAALLKDYYLKL
jgi:tRNA1Val (adenine37-N6)-methyltransferase